MRVPFVEGGNVGFGGREEGSEVCRKFVLVVSPIQSTQYDKLHRCPC